MPGHSIPSGTARLSGMPAANRLCVQGCQRAAKGPPLTCAGGAGRRERGRPSRGRNTVKDGGKKVGRETKLGR